MVWMSKNRTLAAKRQVKELEIKKLLTIHKAKWEFYMLHYRS